MRPSAGNKTAAGLFPAQRCRAAAEKGNGAHSIALLYLEKKIEQQQ
jgi:hypothetical protein